MSGTLLVTALVLFIMVLFIIEALIIRKHRPTLEREERKQAEGPAQADMRVGTDPTWDFRMQSCFLTRSEAAFFHGVKEILPKDHHVFPKVRLCDVIQPISSGRNYMAAFGRISQKHVDFVMCDSRFKPYMIVEIDGGSHRRERQRKADETKDRALTIAGMPIIRFEVGSDWDFDSLRRHMP